MHLPIGRVSEPKCWPGSADIWSMDDVENKETIVIGIFGGNSDRVTSRGSVLLRSVDLENGAA